MVFNMLKEFTGIEGLSGFEALDLINDTDPGVTQIVFDVKTEEMPALSEKEGQIVRHNFVWITKTINCGNLIVSRRIYDKVEFDKTENKWKVLKVGKPESDILKYPEQWNAFARGTTDIEIGTPLLLLFRTDPSRAEFYKSKYISTIEQLAACTQSHIETLGMGALEDVKRAKAYMSKLQEMAPGIQANGRLSELERENNSLKAQLADLSDKLTQLLTRELEADTPAPIKKRGRKAKEIIEEASL